MLLGKKIILEFREFRREGGDLVKNKERRPRKRKKKDQEHAPSRSSAWAHVHLGRSENKNAWVPPPEILMELVCMQPKRQDF